MERLNAPFVDLYDYMQEEFYMDWNRFKAILIAVCNALIRLEEAAHFVHRDFKPNNVMINPETLEIKIIDFGYSTIEIPGYKIINYFPSFSPEAPSRYEQDMGMFFIFIRELLIDTDIFTDQTIERFIRFIIPVSVYGVRHFRNAYNAYGSVFNNLNTEILKPRNVLDAIETFELPVSTSGGKRGRGRGRSRGRSSNKTQRRSKRK
jgi:serine/threonine protein kinase